MTTGAEKTRPSLMELIAPYQPCIARCTDILRQSARAGSVLVLAEPFMAQGKLMRPLLAFAACHAVGGDPAAALPAAVAIEMVHTASLIHDDIMDGADQRRGIPALHRVHGVDRAITCGDALLLRSFLEVAATGDDNAGTVLAAVRSLADCSIAMCDGQDIDITRAAKDEAGYYDLISKKTGALLIAAVKMGGLLGGAEADQLNALEGYAARTGLVFQIQDDLLDLTASSEKLGKPVGSTLAEEKLTLPILHLLSVISEEERIAVRELMERREPGDISTLCSLLEQHRSLTYARTQAEKFAHEAIRLVRALPEGPGRSTLEHLAWYALERER